MAKILLMILAFIILTFIIIAMHSAMVVSDRFDKNSNNANGNEADDDIVFKEQICPKCKTGKKTYALDPKSETCPYIGCWKLNQCNFYKPLEKVPKNGILSWLRNK